MRHRFKFGDKVRTRENFKCIIIGTQRCVNSLVWVIRNPIITETWWVKIENKIKSNVMLVEKKELKRGWKK